MCTMIPQAILTIGERPDGVFVTFIDGEKPLDDFVATLGDEDKARVVTAINNALDSCAVPKLDNNNKPIPNLLRIYYGMLDKSDTNPQVKLYVEYSKGRHVFVTPSQFKGPISRLLDDLKTSVELLAGALPRKETWHLCGETTERNRGYRV